MTAQRWAVVTGASRGIGAAVAVRLARDGFAVALSGTREDLLTSVAEAIRREGGVVAVHAGDLADPHDLQRLAQGLAAACPSVAALVNNAGVFRGGRLSSMLKLPSSCCAP
jgi:3-oxoacyl-[acyl-carrier protein] reductase